MAITTVDGVIAGMRPPEDFLKVGTAIEAAGIYHSHFYAPGRPGAAVAPTSGVNGAALTAYAGQIPWVNPGAGNSYLARFESRASVIGSILLVDRLWHNSGLSVTSTSSQAIASPTWPARDRDGSTNGETILVGLEVSTVTGAGTPTCTLTYTNQAGTGGKTATFVGLTASNVGTFYPWPLAAGDTGVRAVSAYQQSATWTSGAIHLVAYRVLAIVDLTSVGVGGAVDAITGGFVRLYNDTVPFLLQLSSATAATTLSGRMIVTQG